MIKSSRKDVQELGQVLGGVSIICDRCYDWFCGGSNFWLPVGPLQILPELGSKLIVMS